MTTESDPTPARGLARLRVRALSPETRHRLTAGLIVLVVIYGAFLRFDAITLKYGPVVRPAWLRAVQQTRATQSVLRPDGLTWDPVPKYPHKEGDWTQYAGDSYTYLQYAREMRSFYGAHYREPVFPFATWVALQVLRNQDVAVSFASAAFSVLAIFATYLLGAYAFSRGVGLGAALAMAVEFDLISAGVIGVRDDAFVCAVLLTAWAMLRYSRDPSRGHAIGVGVAAGIACLTRVFAAVFIVPGLAFLLLTDRRPWRSRLGTVGVTVLTAAVIVAPYVINCWVALGDPLPAFNVHAKIYSETEGRAVTVGQTTTGYIGNLIRSRPMRTADTVALGLTTYPFLNKWRGFDVWIPGAGKWLSWAALLGLFLFAGSRDSRLLLLILATSLVPFSFTWKLIAEWRFTEHAYPFFLIAACFAIGQIVAGIRLVAGGGMKHRRPAARTVVFWAAALGVVGAAAWGLTRLLPVLTLEEAIRANEAVVITAGDRDGSYFVEGWSSPIAEGSVTARVSKGPYSVVLVPLPRQQDYSLTVRLDPFPRPTGGHPANLPTVRVSLNDQPLATLDLQWNPERVGAYALQVPAGMVREGMNRLSFVATAPPGAEATFRLWLVRIRPPGA